MLEYFDRIAQTLAEVRLVLVKLNLMWNSGQRRPVDGIDGAFLQSSRCERRC